MNRVYIVIVTKNNDFTRNSTSISQEAYESYELAQEFILSRADKPKLTIPFLYTSTEYTYQIKELDLVPTRAKHPLKPKISYTMLRENMIAATTEAELAEVKDIVDDYAICAVFTDEEYELLKELYKERLLELTLPNSVRKVKRMSL